METITSRNDAESIWEEALKIIKEGIVQEENSDHTYTMWFTSIKPYSIDGDSGHFTLCVTHNFSKTWLEDHYYARISNAIKSVTGVPFKVVIKVDPSLSPAVDNIEKESSLSEVSSGLTTDGFLSDGSVVITPRIKAPTQSSIPRQPTMFDSEITPDQLEKFTFDNFITADSNEFAYAAAMAVAEKPSLIHNPLFIYGNSGLGKTHLLGAIYNYIYENFPNKRILFISASNFVEDFVKYTREGGDGKSVSSFESKYTSVDVLIIDDLQDFKGKAGSESAFYNIFNKMVYSGKHIIMAADRPPKDLSMDERSTSRFKSGLEVDVHPPTYETKLAILHNYTQYCRGEIDDSVLMYLAEISTPNIREMEGAINRLLAWKSIKPAAIINVETAKEVLKDLFPDKSRKIITIDTIQREVCRYYSVSKVDLIGNKRSRNIVFPRQVAMYLARWLTDLSLPKIGEKFGGRDHTTVMHAENKIKKEMNTNKEVFDQIQLLRETIEQKS